MKGINLAYADLSKCDLSECNLTGVSLSYANLYKIGKFVEISDFDKIYQKKYASVIYFFMNRGNAIIFN